MDNVPGWGGGEASDSAQNNLYERVQAIIATIPENSSAIILIPNMSDKFRPLCDRRINIAGADDVDEGTWAVSGMDVYRFGGLEVHELHIIDVPFAHKAAIYCRSRLRKRCREEPADLRIGVYSVTGSQIYIYRHPWWDTEKQTGDRIF